MVKFDCGRAPGLEKRGRRELDEVERTEDKVEDAWGSGLGASMVQSEGGGGSQGKVSLQKTWSHTGILNHLYPLCR